MVQFVAQSGHVGQVQYPSVRTRSRVGVHGDQRVRALCGAVEADEVGELFRGSGDGVGGCPVEGRIGVAGMSGVVGSVGVGGVIGVVGVVGDRGWG